MELWLREKEREKWKEKKREKRLAALLQSGASAPHYFTLSICGRPLVTAITSPTLAPRPSCSIVEVPHKDPFCPRRHRSHIFSALILHEHLRRENTNKGKTRLGHREGWRIMMSQKKKPAFPDHRVWPCDARSHKVCVRLLAWYRWCDRLNELLCSENCK